MLQNQNTWVLPIPAGPTNSVKTPNGIPPHKASSKPFKRVERWPAKLSLSTRCSNRSNAYKVLPQDSVISGQIGKIIIIKSKRKESRACISVQFGTVDTRLH